MNEIVINEIVVIEILLYILINNSTRFTHDYNASTETMSAVGSSEHLFRPSSPSQQSTRSVNRRHAVQPDTQAVWGPGLSSIPDDHLYPPNSTPCKPFHFPLYIPLPILACQLLMIFFFLFSCCSPQ